MNTSTGDALHSVGEVAAATGLTVRTLHHYEEIGLVVPAERTEADHRRYGSVELQRLYQVRLLRQLGLPLAEIATALEGSEASVRRAMTSHLTDLEQQLTMTSRLRDRLSVALAHDSGEIDPTVGLLGVLEDMTMLDSPVQRRISILVYRDLEGAFDYLQRVFGLGPGSLTRDAEGTVVHGELEAGDGVLWLHAESPEFKLASPASLGATSASMAVMVDDVDAHHRHAAGEGATIVYEPIDQPYGYREYSARDLEGHLWSFMRLLD